MNPGKRRDRIGGLYAIADTGVLAPVELIVAVELAIAGGARVIQYRDKYCDAVRRGEQAQHLSELCHKQGVTFIINDDVALARAVNADGVHLGRDDPGIHAARARLGADALIGVSCYNEIARAREAVQAGADYVAFGSFYASPVKPKAVRATPALLRQAKQELHVPVVAIGGITPENGADLVAAGADAVAVISGVFSADDIRGSAEKYSRLFTQATMF